VCVCVCVCVRVCVRRAVPSRPFKFVVTTDGLGGVQFNWSSVINASSYTLYSCRRSLDYSVTGDKCINISDVRRNLETVEFAE